jgi:hypothetical protein
VTETKATESKPTEPTVTETKATESQPTETVPTEITPTTTEPQKKFETADVNNDGEINVKDVNLILKIAFGLLTPTDDQKKSADINGDGDVTMLDYVYLQAYLISPEHSSQPTSEVILNAIEISETDTLYKVYIYQGNELSTTYTVDKYETANLDLNGDGAVNVSDAVYIQKYLAGIVKFNKNKIRSADINKDRKVNITDSLTLQKTLAALSKL